MSVRKHVESFESVAIQGAFLFEGCWRVWTKKNRSRYDRSRLRYPSDLTDEEWALVEPLIPPAS